MPRLFCLVFLGFTLSCSSSARSLSTKSTDPNFEWRYHGADAASTKFVPLDNINADNFKDLRVLWRWPAADGQRSDSHRSTPICIDGVLYTGSRQTGLVAIDGATGQELWHFSPGSEGPYRGVAYWTDGQEARILMGTNRYNLYSVDAKTGLADSTFGDNGRVDLYKNIHRKTRKRNYSTLSPPLVVGDVVMVGSTISDYRDNSPPEFMPPGDVLAYDVRSGQHLWTFHTVPQNDEFGTDTWENESWKNFGSTNAWGTLSADLELGYVYLPLSTPSHDFYGGERPGANLFGESLVCLDAKTGQRIWHYQLLHHGLWDYDLPSAPILVDVEVDGKPIKAVAQLTKQGFCFVFNRVTGEPLWPIVERPVPASGVPGEQAFPTQPFPTKPAAFDRQGVSEEDLIDFTPQLRKQALELVKPYSFGPLYTPPSETGVLILPGLVGGSDWVGGAVDPQRGWLYVPSHTILQTVGVKPVTRSNAFSKYSGWAEERSNGPQGLPLTKPPYGRLTAIDLNTGEHRWMRPIGKGPVDHPALRDLDLPDLGWPTRNFVLATPNLVLTTSQEPDDLFRLRGDYFIPSEALLRAYDPEDGQLIGQVELPNNANGNPMSYLADGRQFIVVPLNGGQTGSLVALAVPRPDEVPLASPTLARDDAEHPNFYQAVDALERGDAPALHTLLKQHPELVSARGGLEDNYRPRQLRGATLLHHIAGHTMRAPLPANIAQLAAILLEAGADPNAQTNAEEPPLGLVFSGQQPRWAGVQAQLATLLLEAGADPNFADGKLLWTALNYNQQEVAQLLVDRGAATNLRFAAGLNRLDLLETYLAAGKDNPALDRGPSYRPGSKRKRQGQDLLDEALGYASYAGAVDAVKFLLDRGAQLNAQPGNIFRGRDRGATALHRAIAGQNLATVELLLALGADPTLEDRQHNNTPQGWAEFYGFTSIARILKEAVERHKNQ